MESVILIVRLVQVQKMINVSNAKKEIKINIIFVFLRIIFLLIVSVLQHILYPLKVNVYIGMAGKHHNANVYQDSLNLKAFVRYVAKMKNLEMENVVVLIRL